ncbi:MAG TPA: GNAT family N-acetyltransferase [Azospira sp.]|nr:GNAT family N-acetyltransferase [Azospira sp.]
MDTKKSSSFRLHLRPIKPSDQDFLLRVYASTREQDRALAGWSEPEWLQFLQQQFDFQHEQYTRNYANRTFDLVLVDDQPAGRLYVNRQGSEIRVVDIALLPNFRRQGIGGGLLRRLLQESDGSGNYLGLHVERNNPILDFYQQLGFSTVADRGVYLYMVRQPSPGGVTGAAT